MADVESLELQITGDAEGAKKSLDTLISTLDKLKTTTQGGCGLGSISQNLGRLASEANKLSGAEGKKLGTLANGLKALANLGNLKLSSSVANQISAMGTAVKNLDGVDYSKLGGLATALKPLNDLGKSNLGSTLNQIKKLPDAMKALDSVDMPSLTSKVQSLATAFKPLADEMQKVSNGFSAFPTKIQRYIDSSDGMSSSNDKSALSFAKFATKVAAAAMTLKKLGSVVASWIKISNDHIENVNLFTVAMGKYADAAYQDADKIGEAMGIDPSEWMRNQGVFMTLASGFGVVGDRANVMSKQLTQLGYDISSFYNTSVEDAMTKLQSGISGELEPLRRLGYDLSQAKLEATALSLGIDKAVSSMTQAEKAELRYYAIMTQVTTVHGDMARTLDAPANQLRILNAQVTQTARALGNLFIPALNAVLPYAIALVKVVRLLAESIASLFGASMTEVDFSGAGSDMGDLADNAGSAGNAIDSATESAKKLKKSLLGIDELNVMPDTSGAGDTDNAGSGFNFDLPTYDFIGEATDSRVNQIVEDMKKWLGLTGEINSWADLFDTRLGKILTSVGLIGVAFAAWKVSKSIITVMDKIKKLSSNKIKLSFSVVGATLLMSDLDKLKQYFEDFSKNGATFKNVSGMLSEFAGLIGDALILLGNVKLGGAMKMVQGLGEIVSSINAIAEEGVNVTNVTDLIRGLTNIAISIGIFTKNNQLTGASLAIQGLTTVIQELAENAEAIKNGDWSGVDKATLVIGAIEMLTGILTALNVFNLFKKGTNVGESVKNITDVTTVTETVSTTTSTLTTKMTTLAKDLGLGVAILAEVAAAAALFVGAIWLLGVELEQVGIAWEPVIDNAGTIAIAITLGTGVLVGVGAAVASIGTFGTPLIVNIALGTAVLGEIGAATALFLAEILLIGMQLDGIGDAWEPVIDNGEDIAAAIGIGTGILVIVGVAAAALGAAAVASAGLLPVAIGIGAAMLVELAVATGIFCAELQSVGKDLVGIKDAWEPVLDHGETVRAGIALGTTLLIGIGVVAAALGAASVASVGLLPLAIGLGAALLVDLADAFGTFCGSLADVAGDITDTLAPALSGVNDVLPTATSDMSKFIGFMTIFAADMVVYAASSAIAGIAKSIADFVALFTGDPIQKMADEMDSQYTNLQNLVAKLEAVLPLLEDATGLMSEYNTAMDGFNAVSGNGGGLSGLISTMIEVGVSLFKKGWTTITDFVGNLVSTGVSLIKNGWSSISSFVGTAVSTGVSLVKKGWSSITSFVGNAASVSISLVKKGWTSVTSWLGDLTASLGIKLPRIRVKWSSVEFLGASISYPSGLETYAKGGFPDMGQLFIAREAGAELVGNIGGRTAVVNNDQIVESVSRGVYQAVVAAMGSSSGDQVVEAKVNDKVLFEVMVSRARQETVRTGYNPLLGGV